MITFHHSKKANNVTFVPVTSGLGLI